MTEAETLSAAMDRLVATVETLEMLKNLSMAEWLKSVLDAPPELEAVLPQDIPKSPPVGHS